MLIFYDKQKFQTRATKLEAKNPEIGGIFDSFHTYDKEHGRLETRCLKASTALNAYLEDWPGLAQVIIDDAFAPANLLCGHSTPNVHFAPILVIPIETGPSLSERRRKPLCPLGVVCSDTAERS